MRRRERTGTTLLRRALVAAGVASAITAVWDAPSHAAGVQLAGRYVLVHADARRTPAHDTLQFLEVHGRLRPLRGVPVGRFAPGAWIVVRGAANGSGVTANAARQVGTTAAPVATGAQSVLVIDVVWGSQAITTTRAAAANFLFGTGDAQRRTMAQYYQDVSHGQVSWAGTVTPTLAIPDPGSCSLSSIANAADGAATAAGYDLSGYTHRMYNFPAQYCTTAGWGEVGGPRSWMTDGLWNLADGYARMVPAHEIGHNFGLYHGHGLDCGAGVVVSAACLTGAAGHRCDDGWPAPCVSEYGFSFDLMGNNWTSDPYDAVNWMALPEELQLGWVTGRTLADSPPSAPADHSFTVGPIEQATGNVGLVVSTPKRRYFVEYRQPLGQDAFLTHWPDATTGVLISSDDALEDAGPASLDTDPDSCLTDVYCDWHDAALGVGQTFADVDGAFTLTVDAAGPAGATITIHWTPPADATAPTVTKPPAQHFNVPSAITAGGLVPVAQDFAATDASGVCGYQLYEAVNGGAFGSVWSGTAQTAVRRLAPGSRYQYGITASDCAPAHNTSLLGAAAEGPRFAVAQDQETATAIAYSGAWTRQAVAGAWQGYERFASAAGASATITWTGRNIAWVATKAPDRGSARVYVDGSLRANVDLHQTATQQRQLVFKNGWSTRGTHTLRIVVLGTTGHPRVDVDGFVLLA